MSQGIGFKVTDEEADRIKSGYQSLHHGAQTACELWPYVREAVLSELQALFSADELRLMSELDLPLSCDKSVLSAISGCSGLDASKVDQLTESQVIVVVDLIAQRMLVESDEPAPETSN